ncbi:hypothetical protein F2Q69_00060469 [Brassica cretica]|uniref:3-hydroxyacyl-CoA dehydrogenase NAD binding domain-containing protein n=1 Tax=Brassica cretica TaxID=69181 RepID=A0A8S9RNW3_BRACR|nr:hypothetical protein F2Q69_00060469 [Brassica cretica]
MAGEGHDVHWGGRPAFLLPFNLSKSISSEEGHKLGLIDALEAESFKQLVLSDTAKALVHVFFAQRATSKVPKVTDVGLKPRPMKKVAVIGGGLMGSGIATALLLSNIRVLLKEINSEYLLKGIKSVEANLKGLVSRGKLTQDKAGKAFSLLKGVLDYTEFKDVDMVIETREGPQIDVKPVPHSIDSTASSSFPQRSQVQT